MEILRNANWRDGLGAPLMTHGRERSIQDTSGHLPLCSKRNMGVEGEFENWGSQAGAQSTKSHDSSHKFWVSCLRWEQHPSGACCLVGTLCLGSESFTAITVYTSWSLEAENTCKLRRGGRVYLSQKDEQNQRTVIIYKLYLNSCCCWQMSLWWGMEGGVFLYCTFLSCLEAFITMKIIDQGNTGKKSRYNTSFLASTNPIPSRLSLPHSVLWTYLDQKLNAFTPWMASPLLAHSPPSPPLSAALCKKPWEIALLSYPNLLIAYSISPAEGPAPFGCHIW